MKKPEFDGGINIALKIPKDQYDKTIAFYRDVLGFELQEEESEHIKKSFSCQFGKNKLWFDMVENYSKTDVWLELKTSDISEARNYLTQHGINFRDELERLPQDLNANWMSDPSGTVLLLHE